MKCGNGVKCDKLDKIGLCNTCEGGNVINAAGRISSAGKEMLRYRIALMQHLIEEH